MSDVRPVSKMSLIELVAHQLAYEDLRDMFKRMAEFGIVRYVKRDHVVNWKII